MSEYLTSSDSLDGEYKAVRRKAIAASPSDAHHIEHHESDISRYETFEDLERATNMILSRLSPSSYSADTVLRLRDLNAKRLTTEMLRRAVTSGQLLSLRGKILDFPFAYDDIQQQAYDAFDKEMEGEYYSLMALAGRDRRHLVNLRSTIAEIPFISQERHKGVLEELTKAEKALNIRLN